MLRNHLVGLPFLYVAIGSCWAQGRADDSSAIALLKEKGLSKAGTTFVIEGEKPVLARMKEAKAAFASYAALSERHQMEEQLGTHLADLEQNRVAIQAQVTEMNQAIIEHAATTASNTGNFPRQGNNNPGQRQMADPMVAQRDQLKLTLAEITREQQALKSNQAPPSKDKKALDEEIKLKAEEIKSALADLRPKVDEVAKKYAELKADPSVKQSLEILTKASKVSFKIGPSEPFVAASKSLEAAERKYLGKKTTPASTGKKARGKK